MRMSGVGQVQPSAVLTGLLAVKLLSRHDRIRRPGTGRLSWWVRARHARRGYPVPVGPTMAGTPLWLRFLVTRVDAFTGHYSAGSEVAGPDAGSARFAGGSAAWFSVVSSHTAGRTSSWWKTMR